MLADYFLIKVDGLTALCTIENVTPERKQRRPAAVVITVSDSCARGLREDLSGPAAARALEAAGFETMARVTVEDEREAIEDALRRAAAQAQLVVTTGGTGIGPRDVTPEATRAVCERLLEGVAELMRAAGREQTPLAALSRAVCGTLSGAVVLNLPGSPAGAVQSLEAALPVLPHAVELLAGQTEHGHSAQAAGRKKAKTTAGRKSTGRGAGLRRAGLRRSGKVEDR